MDKTFFIRILGNGRLLVKNNDNGETKMLADTDMLREYLDDYLNIRKENKDDGKKSTENSDIKSPIKRKVLRTN